MASNGNGNETPAFVAKSKVKEFMKAAHGMRVSADALDAINTHLAILLARAAERAGDNKRGTIKPSDL